jgi:hypothetical protein
VASVCGVLYCAANLKAEQRIATFSIVPTQGLECHNQHLDPLMRGQTEWFGVGRPTPMKSDRHKMKAFLGKIFKV